MQKCLLLFFVIAFASASVVRVDHNNVTSVTKEENLPKAGTITWVWTQNGKIPCSDYVRGGDSYDFVDVFQVGRLLYKDHLLPCKVESNPSLTSHAFANHKMSLAVANTYEILCGDGMAWKPVYKATKDTVIPSNALSAGFFSTGEKLYMCRATLVDHIDVGYVDPQFNNQCMYSHTNGVDYSDTYEILVDDTK